MSRNGSGTYNLPQPAFVSGTVISSTAVNSDFNDIANALTASIANDGQTPILANLPMSTYRHTGVGNAVARSDYAAAGQVQDGAFIWCGTAGGTADALTLTPSPAIAAYAAGQVFRFKAGASPNTGAATVAVSGLTAQTIQKDGGALSAADIAAGKWYSLLYDGTNFQLSAWASGAVVAASETVAGVIEIATAAETTTGTDDTRAITPKKLTEWSPATATPDTAADKVIFLDATDSKIKQGAFPAAGITLGTPIAATSGTSIDFTGLPSTVKRITVTFTGVSLDATADMLIQLGDSGGVETTSYTSAMGAIFGGTPTLATSTAGFILTSGAGASITQTGALTLTLLDAATNTWVGVGQLYNVGNSIQVFSGGKALSATLDRIRITTAAGTATFDAGTINIAYEG